jgi:hypothetical protein
MTRPASCAAAVGVLALATLTAISAAEAETRKLPNLGLGYEYDLGSGREEFLLPDPIVDPSVAADHPLYVRIRAPWSMLETSPGAYDWSELDRVVDPYRAARFVIDLCLYGDNPAISPTGQRPGPSAPDVLKAWLEFERATAIHFKGRVRYYEIWDEPNREPQWPAARIAEYAYMLKNSSVTIRSVDPEALIVGGALAIGADTLQDDLAWQESLYGQDIAIYVDVLAVHPAAGAPMESVISKAYDLLLAHDPSAQLWAGKVQVLGESDRDRAADLLARFIVAQGEGSAVVMFDLEADVEGQPEFPGVLLDIHKLFIPTYGRVAGKSVGFEPFAEDARGAIEGVTAYTFFDADAFQGLVAFFARTPPPDGRARMVIDTAAVRGVAVYDIVGGAAGPIRNVKPDFKSNTTRAPVFVYPRPQILQYARVPIKGFETEKEQVEITESGLFTAEEVIAGHQAFMADQTHRLQHYRAEARLTYHAKLGGSGTVDISYDNSFYKDKDAGAEWEQKALYYNGVRWKGKDLPELPIPKAEKVFTLPLDINLNKDYTYEYAGREKVGEYDCHVLRFKPIRPDASLYEGRAWIETRTFAPVKLATVQTNLKSPFVSNDEKDFFLPIAGPDGTTYWLLTRVDGQQIVTVGGRNVVLLREIDFKEFQVNDPGFEAARQASYASDHPVLRETDAGLKYTQRTDTGERVAKEARSSILLGVAGLFHQSGLGFPVLPLAGANYLNYKVRGGDTQLNTFIAGAFNTFTMTNPRTFGRKIDSTVEVLALAFKVSDQLYVRGDKKEKSNVDTGFQSVSGSLGASLGNFFKIKGTYTLDYDVYARDDKTDPSFAVPSDTLVHSGTVEAEFNRSAWTLSASAQRSWRGTWKQWGDRTPASPETLAEFPGSPCDAVGSCFDTFDADQRSYDQYQFSVSKQYFLPLFQKIRFEGTWFTGSRLDRFSEYQFSFFGNRLRGLAGAGVRYDRGGIARLQYAFNIGDVIRFDASLDEAYVKDSLTSDAYDHFTGFGISGNLMGPWETVVQFDVGVALSSDVPGLRGDTEVLVAFLKYFNRSRR